MDPITAIGLVASIFSVIDFASNILQGAWQINDSLSGTLEENRSVEVVVKEMETLSSKLLAPDPSISFGEDRQLCVLALECHTLSEELVKLLKRIKAKNPHSKSQSLWSALKAQIYQKDKEDLLKRLDQCRSQFELQLSFTTR